MKKSFLAKHTTMLTITACVCITIGVYIFFFFDKSISDSTSDWGSFGSYVEGMLVIVSIALLYKTLQEQRKESHRNWFDAGLKRRISSLRERYEENKESFHRLSARMLDNCHHSPFDDCCDYEVAKVRLANLYVDSQIGKENIVESICSYFKSTIIYIGKDKCFDAPIRESYLNELEQSLHQDFINVMLCVLCYLNEDDTICLLGEHNVFFHFQSGNAGIDTLKDCLFSYHRNV